MPSSARIEELKRKFDENPRRYFAPLANEYRKAGDLAEAIRICRVHLPQQPGHMSGHIVFGQALFESGQLDESRAVFEAALQLDPENLIALRHLGDIARGSGDAVSARHWYERVLEADPRNEEIAQQIASLDAEAGGASSATTSGEGATGWGDINPEQQAAPAAEPLFAGELLDEAEVTPAASAGRSPAPAATPDEGAGAHGGPLDLANLGDDAPSRDEPPATPARTEAPAIASSPANDFGFEVMEFQPPPRESHGPVAGLESGEFVPPPGADATPAAFVTETMAELYLQQGFRDEALGVYKQLLAQNPHDEGLRDRIHQLEHGGRASMSIAEVSDEVVDHARKRQTAHAPRTVRAFFGGLAARRAPHADSADSWGDGTPTIAPEVIPRAATPDASWEAAPEEPAATPSSKLRFLTPAEPSAPASADLGGFDLAADVPAADEDEAPTASYDAPADDADAAALAPFDVEVEPEAPAGAGESLGFPDADGPEAYDVTAFEEATMSGALERDAATETDPWATASARRESAATESLGEMELAEDEPATPGHDAAAPAVRPGAPSSGGDALGALFGAAGVAAEDEAAAEALASVFSPKQNGTEGSAETPAGRPTRAAATELSLDHVFRDPNRKAERPRTTGGFSFDQFFSESAGGTASAGPPPGADDAAPDANADIEQFNAWLEGLKKK